MFDGTPGAFTFHTLGVNIEDIDLIGANENFFGVNFGTGRIRGAPASEFSGRIDDMGQASSGCSGMALHYRRLNYLCRLAPRFRDNGNT